LRHAHSFVAAGLLLFALAWPRTSAAQQRPLITEDPEPIGAGRILLEGGLEYNVDAEFPAYGLKGNLWRIPTLGISFGLSSIAELQIDGGLYDHLSISRITRAPLSGLLELTGTSTSDIEDLVVATKVRLVAEGPGRAALALRFSTKLPNAKNENGLGLDTTDFGLSLLVAKTAQSVRLVGNFGFAILGDPTQGTSQNDVLTYGASLAAALTDKAELVAEINGRLSTQDVTGVGAESRSVVRVGARYTRNAVRFDAALSLGLTAADPTVAFGGGFTYVFDAFKVP